MFDVLLVNIPFVLPLIDSYWVEFKENTRFSYSVSHSGGTKCCMKWTLDSSKRYIWSVSSLAGPRCLKTVLDPVFHAFDSEFQVLDS